MFGEEGLALVTYSGPYTGRIKGPCTGQQYPVSAAVTSTFYVDVRDKDGLLTIKATDGRPLFRGAEYVSDEGHQTEETR